MTPRLIFASILLLIGVMIMLMTAKFQKEEMDHDEDYRELLLNASMVQEYILV